MSFITEAVKSEGLLDFFSLRNDINTTTVTASTLSLTINSKFCQIFVGSPAAQLVQLPNATTLQIGHKYEVWNMSAGLIEIKHFGLTPLLSLGNGFVVVVVLRDNSTTAGVWSYISITPADTISNSASPGFSFGRTGVCSGGTYLQNETVPSNVSGRWVYIYNAFLKHVYVSNELTTNYKIEIMYHEGNEVGLTSVGTVSVVAAKGNAFAVNWAVPANKQLAVRIALDTPDSPKNIVCGLGLTGSNA